MKLDADYWTERYEGGTAGWDIGTPSPQLMEIALKFPKDIRILIPGGGNGHEAEALWVRGYNNVFLCDFSEFPRTRQRIPRGSALAPGFFRASRKLRSCVRANFFLCTRPFTS